MTDITTALETVREHLGNVDLSGYDSYERAEWHREGDVALSTIEAELATLRLERGIARQVLEAKAKQYAELVMERDEAIAALRDIAGQTDPYLVDEEACVAYPTLALARLSTPKEDG